MLKKKKKVTQQPAKNIKINCLNFFDVISQLQQIRLLVCLENTNIFNSLSPRAKPCVRLEPASLNGWCKGGVPSTGDLSLPFWPFPRRRTCNVNGGRKEWFILNWIRRALLLTAADILVKDNSSPSPSPIPRIISIELFLKDLGVSQTNTNKNHLRGLLHYFWVPLWTHQLKHLGMGPGRPILNKFPKNCWSRDGWEHSGKH